MKKIICLTVAVISVFVYGFAMAGVEPSPFQPEINQLHSIELGIAAINERMDHLHAMPNMPAGSENYLNAMAKQLDILNARLADVLIVLPSPSLISPYEGQDEVLFSLDAIHVYSGEYNLVIDEITSRMGVEPSPFKIGSENIINIIDIHFLPILPPLLQ
jgi:hypothetical protein